MNIQQLVPASQLARNLGVKLLVYGPPGTGKTPIANTAPRPVLLACEPGMRSMANSQIPTFEAYTVPRALEFFDWLFGSAEAANFDTVAIDSVSEFSEMILRQELGRHKDPRKSYGELSRIVYEKLAGVYFLQQKHVYLIAKQGMLEVTGGLMTRPYFPGQDLNVKIPHLFDEVLRLEKMLNPQTGKYQSVFRTQGTDNIVARDRSGQLAELEPPDLNYVIGKCMQ